MSTTSTTPSVHAWIYKDDGSDMFALHQHSPVRTVSAIDLAHLGVEYHHLPLGDADPLLPTLRAERGYENSDVVNITDSFPAEKLVQFYDEHLHEDEEIRLCLEGSGFFDVRAKNDVDWIRIHIFPGDLIIIPAGIYHRFALDAKKSIRAMRLFTSAPKWIALSRSEPATADVPSRETFLSLLKKTGSGHPVIRREGDAPAALANYPHARTHNGLIYLSGFSSRRPDNSFRGATMTEDGIKLDMGEQTKGVIENMQGVLRTLGADLDHMLDVTVFLTDMSLYKEFNAAYNLYFNAQSGPSRTTVGVKELPHPHILVEIKGVAAQSL